MDRFGLKGVFHNNCLDKTAAETRERLSKEANGCFYFVAKERDTEKMTQVNDIRVTLLWRLNSAQTVIKDIRVIYQPGSRFPRYELNQVRYESLLHLENTYLDKV